MMLLSHVLYVPRDLDVVFVVASMISVITAQSNSLKRNPTLEHALSMKLCPSR